MNPYPIFGLGFLIGILFSLVMLQIFGGQFIKRKVEEELERKGIKWEEF